MFRLAAGLALSLFVAAPGAASPPSPPEVAAYADRLLSEVNAAGGPGMAVLVARGDDVLHRGAYGHASVELGVPMRPEHVLRIASVTKQFVAAGLLKLVDEGRAGLDDPLSNYLPGYPGGEAITLAQLLNHTSGIVSYTSIPGYMAGNDIRRQLDTAGLVDVFKDRPADFAPGEGWFYNNSGYVLVGAVIEAITGMDWHAWIDEAIARPLGLAHTRYGADEAVIAGQADGYSVTPQGQVQRAHMGSMSQPHAAGALVSTVDDLWRWNRALHTGRLLSSESYRRMITPEGAAATAPMRYGYGIIAGTVRGRPALFHSGGIFGFQSMLLYLPEQEITVVALRNADSGPVNPVLTANRLAAFALGDPYPEPTPVALPVEHLRALAGDYRVGESGVQRLSVQDGRLVSQTLGGPPLTLTAFDADRFGYPGSLSRIEAVRDADGRVTGVRFYNQGEEPAQLRPRVD